MSNPAPDPDQHADERLAAAHRHWSESDEITSLIPQPPHSNDPGFMKAEDSPTGVVRPIRTSDEQLRDEMPFPEIPRSPGDPLPGALTLNEGEFFAPGFGPGADTVTGKDALQGLAERAGSALPNDAGLDLRAPPPSELDLASATRQNSDGSFSVAAGSIAVPLEELAKVGERTVRQCIGDALKSWPTDFIRYVESGEATRSSDPLNYDTMMSVLYRNVCKNLRDKDINP